MTSNLGADIIAELPEETDIEEARSGVMEIVRKTFKPEFINRLDEIILFNRLSASNIQSIVDIQLQKLEGMLADKKITVKMDEGAKKWLSVMGYSPVYGARPLKRVIQNNILNPLAEKFLKGELVENSTIECTEKNGKLEFVIESNG